MKKIRLFVLAGIFMFSLNAVSAAEATDPKVNEPEGQAAQLENRVHEIWKMDFSEMDDTQKNALKSELKKIKKDVKQMKKDGLDDKVSISIGAIIIILLIIIII